MQDCTRIGNIVLVSALPPIFSLRMSQDGLVLFELFLSCCARTVAMWVGMAGWEAL
jgi:hypothetical protein